MSLLKLLQEQTGDDDTIPIREDAVSNKESSKRETVRYAVTNLESWETDEPHHYARDVGIDGTCFRRLDPDYYAWLRHKMELAKKAAAIALGAAQKLVGVCTGCKRRANSIVPLRQDRVVLDVDLLGQLRLDYVLSNFYNCLVINEPCLSSSSGLADIRHR